MIHPEYPSNWYVNQMVLKALDAADRAGFLRRPEVDPLTGLTWRWIATSWCVENSVLKFYKEGKPIETPWEVT